MIKHTSIFGISLLLALVGIINAFTSGDYSVFAGLLFPLLLILVLFYVYKIAPGRTASGRGGVSRSKVKVKPSQKTLAKVAGTRKTPSVSGKRKSYPFQVIEGSKGKNDDQQPKFH
ncbi:hypothetical protein [Paenibacillus donghaensis]|uniref:Uncharacterized protein n=1 Tax=Paenibacillus donghaensis TaxID=414771 RepID=A0A2Z2KC33_9BACL|nr:hypothetical protein [Paenibacillus donghaensis]ASA23147.1 hypothetical protein B9T62_21475 [Paenibacillus donghaensis]